MSDTKQEIKLSRSEAREQAFMLLFSRSFVQEPLEDTLADAEELFEGGVCDYARVVVMGIEAVQDEIDADIARFLKKGWSLSRISRTSLTILRLVLHRESRITLPLLCVAVAVGFALLTEHNSFQLARLADRVFPLSAACIGFGLFPLTLLVGLLRKKI